MSEDTLTALSQRDEAFWIGLVFLVGGGVVPEGYHIGGQELAGICIALGAVIITVRLFVSVFRIIRTTAEAGAGGYSDSKSGH